jgi:predicted RNA-binding protein with PUA-like domain
MKYWLMKSEPDAFSIDDLKEKKRAPWDGVRNFQARNFMKAQDIGDLVLFYHSNAHPPGVAGIAKVVKKAYPDFTQFDRHSKYFDLKSSEEKPRWYMVDVEYVQHFKRFVSLSELREIPEIQNMVLLNRSRLSVQPVTPDEWKIIVAMGGIKNV